MGKKRKRKWGSWESVGDIFAEGGQGRLYLVKNLSDASEEIYVLKELKNPKRKKRFEREITAIANIGPHPNVIQLVDAGIYRDENKPCYIMPRADCSLDMYLPVMSKNTKLSFEVFQLICAGVEHLHKADIVHRDLKPENILIFSGTPKISDFGICLVANENRLTSTSEAVGPRFYMAPELEDGKNLNVSPSSDVYSLGKILYFILSKGKIFSREKYNQPKFNLSKIFNDPRHEIFSKLFGRSISAHLHERYKNASELLLGFNVSVEKFINHPRTRICSKLGSFEKTKTYEPALLKKLDNEEWRELFSFYRSQDLTPPIEFFELAAKHLAEKHIGDLIFLLLENESHLNVKNLIKLSGIIALQNDPEKIHFFMRHDYVERFLLLALDNNSPKITDTVARISFFTLRQHQQVILRLSKHFIDLSPESKKNFVLSSYQTEFEGKLELFSSILENDDLDDISFEPVVAGLCSTNDHSTLERLAAIGDNLEKGDRLGAFGRGIILGSRDEAIEFFKNYKWKNRVIEILCDVMGKNDSDNEEPEE
jgi:serine/threonine protein kinase